MSPSLFLTHYLVQVSSFLWSAPSPGPSGGSTLGGIDLNAPAKPIPGLGPQINDWLGWVKSLAIAAGVVGILVSAIMMMIGRRNRSHLSAEGATGLLWVIAGLSVASMAGGIVATVMGG
jgi:uncharacterized protein involved in cysteine biosynthesis